MVALIRICSISTAESLYHPIEGVALAVVDAFKKVKHFVIAVDIKPLEKVFGDRSLDGIKNSKLRNLKDKSLKTRPRSWYAQQSGGGNVKTPYERSNPPRTAR